MTVFRRIAVAALALGLMAQSASACPMCKEALSAGGGDLVSGFFYSILFMLSMPFMIVTGMGTYMYVLVRRARATQSADPQSPFSPPDESATA